MVTKLGIGTVILITVVNGLEQFFILKNVLYASDVMHSFTPAYVPSKEARVSGTDR